MSVVENSRRRFIKQALLSFFAIPIARHGVFLATESIVVRLEGQADDLGNELVNFGLPLPSNFLNESKKVRILAEDGSELIAAIRSLEPWRVGGHDGSIRSLLVQFKLDFSKQRNQRVTIRFDRQTKSTAEFAPITPTLRDEQGLQGPRVLAVLPAEWLCASGIVGPQIPAASSGEY